MGLPSADTAAGLSQLHPLVIRALGHAGASLSEMAGVDIQVISSSIDLVSLADVPATDGLPGEAVVAVYVAMLGDGQGHVLLLMDDAVARELAGLLLCEDPSTLVISDEMTASALAEAGNVTCSAFMNVVGDASGLRLDVTPPAVVYDMRGAILDSVVADIALLGDTALVIGTRFYMPTRDLQDVQGLDVRFLMIPSPATLGELLERARRQVLRQ
jgi:chemotaxis protein CheC